MASALEIIVAPRPPFSLLYGMTITLVLLAVSWLGMAQRRLRPPPQKTGYSRGSTVMK